LNNSFGTTFGTTFCSLFSLVKNNRERKRKRENKKIMWVWKKKLYKNCIKMVVQISFLIPWRGKYFQPSRKWKLRLSFFHQFSSYILIIWMDWCFNVHIWVFDSLSIPKYWLFNFSCWVKKHFFSHNFGYFYLYISYLMIFLNMNKTLIAFF